MELVAESSRPQVDLSWVTPQLALGGRFSVGLVTELAGRLGIEAVVDLRDEDRDDEMLLRRYGIALLHLPTRDRCAVALSAIDRGVKWVGALLGRGARVHIHCEHGIGRSALLACCVLVSEGYGPLEALELAKRAREKVSPSPEQLEAFRAWSRAWREARGATWTVPEMEQLMEIAYRHLRLQGGAD